MSLDTQELLKKLNQQLEKRGLAHLVKAETCGSPTRTRWLETGNNKFLVPPYGGWSSDEDLALFMQWLLVLATPAAISQETQVGESTP